jgi:putative transport protein
MPASESSPIIEFLAEEPLLLLFMVASIGYAIGRIKIKGTSLGVAAVLFVGLAVGALSPTLALPPIVFELGLVIFVYTIGLASGQGFFASFKNKGLRDNAFFWLMITYSALAAVGAHFLLGFKATITSGMFAGSLTNTPALAGVLDQVRLLAPADQLEAMLSEPTVGYSVTYPMGVLGMILAVYVMQRVWKINYREDALRAREFQAVDQELITRTIHVTNPAVEGKRFSDLWQQFRWPVVFVRVKRDEHVLLSSANVEFRHGDLVSIVGAAEEVEKVIPQLGEPASESLELDRSEYDFRRIFVSNPKVADRHIADLKLPETYDAFVTRVRRGDIDLLARGDTRLELGDRVRVVARRTNMNAVSRFFGDSYKALSEIDLLTFGLGIALGLIIGAIPIPLPGGLTFKLGLAGGPLVVALVLGALGRTGPLVWNLPYSANLTLRQLGLIMLLAGIGLRSGYTFVETFAKSGGITIFLAGAVITISTAFLTLWLGYKLLKIPFGLLIGMLSGLDTQPAVLGFSLQQSENELPNVGYSLIFPIATITKIIYAQLLLLLLSNR